MRTRAEYERVAELLRSGMNDCQVARATGIPRATIRDWRHKGRPGRYVSGRNRPPCPICETGKLPPRAYAYLLGLYLGDGCLSRVRKTWYLRVFQDARYIELIQACATAMRQVSERSVSFAKNPGCVAITIGWNHWPCLFPQHGPGPKHRRKIELAPWQCEIADRHPGLLLAGLIHSDGCRILNPVYGRHYPRYQFTNFSLDIQRIFTDACDAFGVHWTRPKWNTISVARHRDVAKLDRVITPKR